ncbi:hypothetical protein GSY74_07600 [Sulfurovum sp. bin170]|uniref:polysialyltransferase family glycosyltransferase n=1 Tax=Sulfurovum sp. bin170 TaxID=2695268 RepID=UPI0013DFD077|nr:polysialyltransferase family glycosyltransferase [Sulfurovum sp. bin170]NEW61143.1 hypothetical protein [Sulfurovum sp. bin170]
MKRVETKLIIKRKKDFDKGEKNLFMVSTLLQLLSAVEAQRYFNAKNCTLVLLFYGDKNQDETHLKSKLHLFDYDKLVILDKGDAKSYINLNITLIKELRKEHYRRVFVGFFGANMRRFIANIGYEELFLIDDGVYTISIHNELYSSNTEGYKKYITAFSEKERKGRLKKLKFALYHNFRKSYLLLYGYKNDMRKMKLNFFTMFQLPQYQDEIIITHKFEALREQYNLSSDTNKDDTIYFLGQPLDRVIDISSEQYLRYLKTIFEKYKQENKSIIYIPHRAENKNLLDEIEVMDEYNLQILKPDIAFELYVLDNRINITHIASFTSTALSSIKKLFPSAKVEAFKFPMEGEIGKTSSLIYSLFADEGIAVYEWNMCCLYQTKDEESLCHQ